MWYLNSFLYPAHNNSYSAIVWLLCTMNKVCSSTLGVLWQYKTSRYEVSFTNLTGHTCSWFRNGDHWNNQRSLLKNTTHTLSKHSNSIFTTWSMKSPPTRLLYYMAFNRFEVPRRVYNCDTPFYIFRTSNTDLFMGLLDVCAHMCSHCKIVILNT